MSEPHNTPAPTARRSRRSEKIRWAGENEVAHGELTDRDLKRMAVQVAAGVFQSSCQDGEPHLTTLEAVELANVLIASAASDANVLRLDKLLECGDKDADPMIVLGKVESAVRQSLKDRLRNRYEARKKDERDADAAFAADLRRTPMPQS